MNLAKQNKTSFPKVWDEWVSDFFSKVPELSFPSMQNMPAVNVKETDTAFEIEAALPGMKKEDISVRIEHGVLQLNAGQKSESESKEGDYTRKEFSYHSFSRSFRLPENADQDKVDAAYADGILRLTIAKKNLVSGSEGKNIQIA